MVTNMICNTFSIVACDLEENAWGVAVASKFLAAGSVVSWAKASVGAIATQALAKVGFGPDGLNLLGDGRTATDTLEIILSKDPGKEDRQVAIVDSCGRVAVHTGKKCFGWSGHKVGEGFSCQGNMLTGPETLQAMATSYQSAPGELADRLVSALQSGDNAGGDKRGKQSAAVLVVRPQGGYGGDTDRYLDLRVDDDPEPVTRLKHLVQTHHTFFGAASTENKTRIDPAMATKIQTILKQDGYYTGPLHGSWDKTSREAFVLLLSKAKLEQHWNVVRQSDMIDQVILEHLLVRFAEIE